MWLLTTQQRREEHNALPLVEDGFGRVSVRTTLSAGRWLTAILVWRTREVHRVAQSSLSRPLATAGVLGRHARHVVGLVLGEVRLRGGARRLPACPTGHSARHDEVGAEPWCSARRWRRCVSEPVDRPQLFVDGAVPMSDNRTPPPLPGRKLGSFVLQPTPRDIDLYTNAEQHVTCASCAKFRLRAGQEQMQRERFLERLVRENEWRIRHLGAPPETFGLCAETSDTITSMYSRACEHYRPANGRLR